MKQTNTSVPTLTPTPTPTLGLRENWYQFTLLVIVNAFVGAMIGLERSILPKLAEEQFGLAANSAILSFIVVFGFSKAIMNYFAGRFSDRWGRKIILIAGWVLSLPVPFLLIYAPSWSWILVANFFLGISQGLTWSTTVIMKIDLVGPKQRGLAMGLNEFAGYFAVALSALATGYIASHFSLRPEPFYLGFVYTIAGLFLSIFLVKETHAHAKQEIKLHDGHSQIEHHNHKEIFLKTTITDKNLSSVTQAGFVNNLNDGMAWGLFPILFAHSGMTVSQIGWLAAIYPASWGLFQLFTGHWSDSIGRKGLIASGMWVQAVGIAITVLSSSFYVFALGGLFLGIGTAMVYPTLLAAIGDVAHPTWRASAVGVYRLWRDSGYAIGAIVAGITADIFGLETAIWFVAVITAVSGLIVALRMKETLKIETSNCIEADLVRQKITSLSAIVIDVRSTTEFENGHIDGAVSMPLDELPKIAGSLPKEILIVTVCGKGGGRSEQAAKLLRANGWRNTRWLCGGYFGWMGISSS